MRPSLHPRLVNGPFDDPGLFIPFVFKRHAVMFDLGDIHALPPKDILKISHVFVSHTHMDHFSGFDRLLRILLGREKILFLYGPEGFLKNVEGKLSGYSWDLVHNYHNRFELHVFEINKGNILSQRYLCSNQFKPPQKTSTFPFKKVIVERPDFFVTAERLAHSIPCLGFCMQERFHVNIKKNAVLALGLDIGPWLNTFKHALYTDRHPESLFEIPSRDAQKPSNHFSLKELTEKIAIITPGQKTAYITDVSYTDANVKRMIAFAQDSDQLFIEAAFLDSEKEIAEKKHHLTAKQAGHIAGKANAKKFTIFHFSPRYKGMEEMLYKEATTAYEKALNLGS